MTLLDSASRKWERENAQLADREFRALARKLTTKDEAELLAFAQDALDLLRQIRTRDGVKIQRHHDAAGEFVDDAIDQFLGLLAESVSRTEGTDS